MGNNQNTTNATCDHGDDDVKNKLNNNRLVWLKSELRRKDIEDEFRLIDNQLKIFDDENLCGKYILSIPSNEQVVFIVDDRQGEQIVPFIHRLRQLKRIYVYRKDQKGFDQWTKQHSKVGHVNFFVIIKCFCFII